MRRVECDTVEIRLQRSVGIEAVARAYEFQERLLEEVFREVRIAAPAPQKAK